MSDSIKTTVNIKREVIISGQHCHAACEGIGFGYCVYFRETLYCDRRTKGLDLLRCRECRAATKAKEKRHAHSP